jgi:hypothetical protein
MLKDTRIAELRSQICASLNYCLRTGRVNLLIPTAFFQGPAENAIPASRMDIRAAVGMILIPDGYR